MKLKDSCKKPIFMSISFIAMVIFAIVIVSCGGEEENIDGGKPSHDGLIDSGRKLLSITVRSSESDLASTIVYNYDKNGNCIGCTRGTNDFNFCDTTITTAPRQDSYDKETISYDNGLIGGYTKETISTLPGRGVLSSTTYKYGYSSDGYLYSIDYRSMGTVTPFEHNNNMRIKNLNGELISFAAEETGYSSYQVGLYIGGAYHATYSFQLNNSVPNIYGIHPYSLVSVLGMVPVDAYFAGKMGKAYVNLPTNISYTKSVRKVGNGATNKNVATETHNITSTYEYNLEKDVVYEKVVETSVNSVDKITRTFAVSIEYHFSH